DDKVTIGGHGQVVAEVELFERTAFEEQLEPIGPGVLWTQPEYLPQFRCPAAGAHEIELTVSHRHAFAAMEQRGAGGCTALAQVVGWRINVLEIDPAHGLPTARREALAVEVAGIRQSVDGESLELASLGQTGGDLRDEAVE